MARRKTVKLNVSAARSAISAKYRHNVMFCEDMGRKGQASWVSNWSLTPPKNLPSPEEAAKMCQLLGVTPEEIISDAADVELVRSLLPSPSAGVVPGDLDDPKIAKVNSILAQVSDFTEEELAEIEAFIQFRRSRRQE